MPPACQQANTPNPKSDMPIYAYKCDSCGHAKDVLQKMSDAPLTQCPACGAQTFSKQVTAAGFQLKGSGWYATDFKGGGTPATAIDKASEASQSGDAKAGDPKASDPKAGGAKPADSGSKPAESKPAVPASAPADSGTSGSK